MSYHPTDIVEVRAWNQLVGAVGPAHPGTGAYGFAYAPEWIAGGVELAPLMMPLRPEPYSFPDLPSRTFYGLPALLADVLPDAFGNALVNAWMAGHGVAVTSISPLDRLAYAADRPLGALEFRPPARDADGEPSTVVALLDLVHARRRSGGVQQRRGRPRRPSATHPGRHQRGRGTGESRRAVSFNPTTFQGRSPTAPLARLRAVAAIKLDGVSGTGLDGQVPATDSGTARPTGDIDTPTPMATDAGGTFARPTAGRGTAPPATS